MRIGRLILVLTLIGFGACGVRAEETATSDTPKKEATVSAQVCIAVVTFGGDDQNMVTEILSTDLAKSGMLKLVERSRLKENLKELKLPETGLVETKDAVNLGKLSGARRLITGSLVRNEGKILINARLIETESGEIVKGDNVEGYQSDLFFLVHQLANRVHYRITEQWIPDVDKPSENPVTAQPEPIITNPRSDLKVEVKLNKPISGTYHKDDKLLISFRANANCYVTLYNIDSKGKVNLLYPNQYAPKNYILKDVLYTIPGKDDPYDLQITETSGNGMEYIQAIATSKALDLIRNQESTAKSALMPEIADSPAEFVTKAVTLKLKTQEKNDWGADVVKFYVAVE